MNTAQKEAVVTALFAKLGRTPLIMLADYRGVNVAQINAFRRSLDAAGMDYVVVKNTLGRRVVEGTNKEGLVPYLTGMTGWVIAGDDPIASAKLIRDVTKDFKKANLFEVKGGWFDGEALDAQAIQKVADLPSKEELLVMLLRTIQEGPRRLLGVLQAPARDLLYLLKNYEKKLEEAE